MGAKWFAEHLAADGQAVPPMLAKAAEAGAFYRVEQGVLQQLGTDGAYHDVVRPAGVLLLQDVKRRSEPVAKNGSAALWDLGDGVLCLEFTSKMNALDEAIIRLLLKAMAMVDGKRYVAIVLHNEGSNFSVGANIGIALFAANLAMWPV